MKKYTVSHEWIQIEQGIGTVGITEFARRELGEIVYIETPPLKKKLSLGQESAVLESTKAAVDMYSPVTGEVVDVNGALVEDLSLLTKDPEGAGWVFKLRVEDPSELEHLLDEGEYRVMIQE